MKESSKAEMAKIAKSLDILVDQIRHQLYDLSLTDEEYNELDEIHKVAKAAFIRLVVLAQKK